MAAVELGIAGIIVGTGLSGHPPGRLLLKTVAFVLLAIAVTIAMQTLGFAPATKAG